MLYDDPIWEYTEPDRAQVLMGYLHEKILEHLEKTKEQRQNSVLEAKLRHGEVRLFEEDIKQRLNLVKGLVEQIQEKDQQIARNDAILREQLAVIQELTAKIKNIVLTSTNLPEDTDVLSDAEVAAVIECINNANIESLPMFEKILVFKKCANIDKVVPIEIRDTVILSMTLNILDFCEEGYPFYEQLSKQDYLDSIKHPFTRECAWLYEQPVWSNQDPDRIQTILDFVKPYVKERLDEKIAERKKSVEDAHLSKGRLIGLEDLLKISNHRVKSLENMIHEKDELMAGQNAVIREQMKMINKLSEQIANTSLLL